MAILVRDKAFYRQLLHIALPVSLQNLITFSITMADTVMVGRLGEVQLTACSIATQLGFIFTLITFGVASGSNVMIAQYWGKGDTAPIHRVMTIMYRVVIVSALVLGAVAFLFPRRFMTIFSPGDAQVVREGVRYLRVIGISYLFSGLAISSVIVLRAVGTVRISLVVFGGSLLWNVFFNWLLIFGKLGAPPLGVQGAAIATCLARVWEILSVLVYFIFFEKKICYRLRYLFFRKLGIVRTFLETSMPVIINETLWGGGMVVFAIIIGHMGRPCTAAYSVCRVLNDMVTVGIHGVGGAAAVVIGNTVGQGRYDMARERAKSFMALSVVLGLVAMGIVLMLRGPLLSLYNISDVALGYAGQVMLLYAFVAIFQAGSSVMLIGVLRGGGDTRFVMFMDLIFMWLVSIPLGFFASTRLGWSMPVVYALLMSDEVFKCCGACVRVLRGRWINDITKIRVER